jgi:lysophospholipase L1-like esterase
LRTRAAGLGDEVARFDLWYAAQPGGGRLGVQVDGGERVVVDTRADRLEDRYHEIEVEPGRHSIEVEALGYGPARTYGVVLETRGPGVTWEQFSMLGVFTRRMHAWDDEHIAGHVARRDADLVVFAYGGNDVRRVSAGKLDKEAYVAEYAKVVEKVRAGKPGMSCLILAITDRAKSLEITLRPEHLDLIVEGQREVARRTGCAFFDTYTAMGGGGSLLEWRKRKPPLAAADLKHLNHRGWELVGGWIYDAILAGYIDYRRSGRAR